MKTWLLALTPSLSGVLWTVALVVDPGPLDQGSVLLVAVGLNLVTTVAVFGLVLVGARWSRRLAVAGLIGGLGIGALRPIDGIWIAALVVTAVGAMSLYSPALSAGIRKLPAAAGPPTRAVLLPLLLIAAPYIYGVAPGDATVVVLIAGLTAPIVGFLYSRVIPGGLVAVRFVWPAIALGLAPWMDAGVAVASVSMAIAVLTIAWHSTVKVAYHPPRETGTAYPIPPELAPTEILDAANIDDKGRPK